MTRPIESATEIYRHLKADDMFEHAGPESRHVLLPTDDFLRGITALLHDTIDNNAKGMLLYAHGMLQAVGEDGIMVRMKGPDDIEIRGASNLPNHEGNPTPEELMKMVFQFENSIQINLRGHGPMLYISAFSQDENIEDTVNAGIQMIPEQAQTALVKGLLDIVSENLNNILNS